MAAIDHTCIFFKNGMHVKETGYLNENDEWVNLMPFEWGRDGNIIKIGNAYVCEKSTGYHSEYDALYCRAGIEGPLNFKGLNWYGKLYALKQWFKWKLHIKERCWRYKYTKEVSTWSEGDKELYIYHDGLKDSYVSFFKDGKDTYVVIGGYGHHENVYTHFYGRGYGDSFEKMMALEAYDWAVKTVLREVADSMTYGKGWEACDELYDRLKGYFWSRRYDIGYSFETWEDEGV